MTSEDLSAYDNFVFDTETNTWIPPIPYPDDGKSYFWSLDQAKWLELKVIVK
jgi:hypothetical protein